jgi:hypothetical protein
MRRIVWSAMILALLLYWIVPVSYAQSTPTKTPVIAVGTANRNANLRAGPGTTFAIVGSVKTGDKLNIVGTNAAKNWYNLDTGAWIATFLVTVPADSAPPAPTQTGGGTTPAPSTPVPPTATPAPVKRDCHSSYSPCVPIASDVDCAGGTGNGPVYVAGPVQVTGPDVYDLDRDGNGVGCE